jgi:hypothetical protein
VTRRTIGAVTRAGASRPGLSSLGSDLSRSSPVLSFAAYVLSPATCNLSFTLSVTLTNSNVVLARRALTTRHLIQQIANLPQPIHHLTVERALIAAASTSLDAAISFVSLVSLFLGRLHTRNSRCV